MTFTPEERYLYGIGTRRYVKRKPWIKQIRLDERVLGNDNSGWFGLCRAPRIGGKAAFLFGCLGCGGLKIIRSDTVRFDPPGGTQCRPKNYNRRFDADTVRQIRRLYSTMTVRAIAERFRAPKPTLYGVVSGKQYRWVR